MGGKDFVGILRETRKGKSKTVAKKCYKEAEERVKRAGTGTGNVMGIRTNRGFQRSWEKRRRK